MRKITVLLMVAIVSTACVARQGVRTTHIPVPDRIATEHTSDAAFERAWWRQFQDAVLDRLIEEALGANRDVHAAAARYAAARELAGAAALTRLPSGGATVAATRQHASDHEMPGSSDRTTGTLSAGLAVGWEADLFGRLSARARAAAADARTAAADVHGVQVAVAAAVAQSYFELRGAQQELALVTALQARNRELRSLTQTLVDAGRVTRVDLLRAQQVLEELAIEESTARHRAQAARHRIATLAGRPAGDLIIPDSTRVQLTATVLPIGTAADLLRRRPDVQAAEFQVQAMASRAGATRADLFPRVELSGGISLIAGSLGRLTDAAAGSWFIAPRLVWNIVDWPRLRREARAAGHLTDAAFAGYEQAVLRALEEARTAVDAYGATLVQLNAAERRTQAAEETARIIALQYREGMVDSFARLSAERDAITAGVAATRALTAQRSAVVDVYRVLGGGWR